MALGLTLVAHYAAGSSQFVRIDPGRVDFGAVYAEQDVRQEVVIRNVGSSPLVLEEPTASCPACLRIDLSARTLPPQEAIVLTLDYNPGPDLGDHHLHVDIPLSGAEDSVLLPVSASVLPAYRISHDYLYFDQSDLHPAQSAVIQVVPEFEMFGQPDPDSVSTPYYAVAWATPPSDGAPYRFTISPTDAMPRGLTTREFLVPSSDPRDPPFRIVAATLNRPPLHIYPSPVTVSSRNAEQFRILFIEQTSPQLVEILTIESEDPRIRWEFSSTILPDKRLLNLYIVNVGRETETLGDVVISTDHEEQREIRVPVVIDNEQQARARLPQPAGFVASRTRCGCGPR